jgi:hypothetical protein
MAIPIKEDKYATKGEVKRLNDFMTLAIFVMFIGFLILLVTLALAFINTINQDTNSRDLLIQQVQQLNDKLSK